MRQQLFLLVLPESAAMPSNDAGKPGGEAGP
jgi:hypothetical protein